MTKALLNIRPLTPADWRTLRDIRLRALIDSPGAFTSHYHLERRWSENQWRQRFRAATWVVALERGVVVGVAGLVNDHPEEPEHVESVWVAPGHRCRGVARSLLDAMVDAAQRAGLAELLLWVLEDNLRAWRIYIHLGFEWTGERKPIGPDHHRFERRLRLPI
jgi:ribosomal protein S18 acetylase RimI-like enzyme